MGNNGNGNGPSMPPQMMGEAPSISPQMMKVLNDAPLIKCECGCAVFEKGVAFKKISRFLTGDTEDSVVPIGLYVCKKCGKVNKTLADMMRVPEEVYKEVNETKTIIQ